MDSFEPTPLERRLHLALQAMGIVSAAACLPPIMYLLSKDARVNINRFRWLLFAIAISGLLMDLQLSLAIAPYPLLPHIAFWADGLLVHTHRRAIVYLMAIVLFLIYLWVTTMLLAFIFRLGAVMDRSFSRRINHFAYFTIALCAFNTTMSCGILLLKYPAQSRVDGYIMEKLPAMHFLLEKPGFIYFARMDNFHYAQIGMVHITACICFYIIVFVAIFVFINVVLLRVRYLMSTNTRLLHYMLFKSLIAQMILPLFSLIIPFMLTAASIRFGTDGDGVDHQLIAHFSILMASLHSILNTFSMFWFVTPFRRFVSSRVAPMDTTDSQTHLRNSQFSTTSAYAPYVVSSS